MCDIMYDVIHDITKEADLADAAEDESDCAEESVSASSVDKEGEADACELGIRYPTLQSMDAGKLTKQSIQVYIMYDVMYSFMISSVITHIKCRRRAEKRMLVRETPLYTITLQERSAWTCIFSSLHAWMSLQTNSVLMICSLR
jgi:hypothetical protein